MKKVAPKLDENYCVNPKIGITKYIRNKIEKIENARSIEEKSRNIFAVYNTIINTEKICPERNDILFRRDQFYNALVLNLLKIEQESTDYDIEHYFFWIPNAIRELQIIGRNRGL
jgi:hypothetical protein